MNMSLVRPVVLGMKKASKQAYLQGALGLTTTPLVVGGQVLPEQGVVGVAAAVEVEGGGERGGGDLVVLLLGLGDLLQRRVQVRDVGLVVALVVDLHDLAGDVRFQGAIVVCFYYY